MAKKRKAVNKSRASKKSGAKKAHAKRKSPHTQASSCCHSFGGPFKDVCGISAGV
jgi:hypothetical protein